MSMRRRAASRCTRGWQSVSPHSAWICSWAIVHRRSAWFWSGSSVIVRVCSHHDPKIPGRRCQTTVTSLGRWWGLEGRPGGVGQVDLARYMHNPYTITNAGQPKTDEQRYNIAVGAEALLKAPYDWIGIAADGMDAIGAGHLWAQNWKGLGPPAHVVCSSYAAWLYDHYGLEHPVRRSLRETTPGDWTAFDLDNGWNI